MRRRLGGTRRIGGRRRGCASAAPVPSQVPALEPSWNPSQVRGTDRVRFRVFTKWRRGESNRPAEDSGGRRSNLHPHLRRGNLPPATLHYCQLVPEGQPTERQVRSLRTVPTWPIIHPRSSLMSAPLVGEGRHAATT